MKSLLSKIALTSEKSQKYQLRDGDHLVHDYDGSITTLQNAIFKVSTMMVIIWNQVHKYIQRKLYVLHFLTYIPKYYETYIDGLSVNIFHRI